jgi:drug/metabolite transporter (DMT)-like permease
MTRRRTLGALSLAASAFIYACLGPLIRIMDMMYSEYGQMAVRWTCALIIIALLNSIRKNHVFTNQNIRWSLILGFITGCEVLLFTFAITTIKIGTTATLLYAGSLLVGALIGFASGERIGLQKIAALTIALLGLYFYFDIDDATPLLGILFGLGSGIANGLGNGARRALKGLDPLTIMQYQFIVGSIMGIFAVMISSQSFIK